MLDRNGAASVRERCRPRSLTSTDQLGNLRLSIADQLLADGTLLLVMPEMIYHSELSSMSTLWQSVDALALQRLDALLSMEAGAMGITKDILMRELLFATMFSPNG